MSNNKPTQIDSEEWWFKGCFIQKQTHPRLQKYHVFQDAENEQTVACCNTFEEAKKLCKANEVVNYKLGYEAFI